MAFVEFHNVGKTYHLGEVDIHALHDASFEVERASWWLSWAPPVPVKPPF